MELCGLLFPLPNDWGHAILMKYYAVLHRPIGQNGMSTWWIGAEDKKPLVFPRNEEIIAIWQRAVGVRIEILCDKYINHRIVAIPTGIKVENRKRFLKAILPHVRFRTSVTF